MSLFFIFTFLFDSIRPSNTCKVFLCENPATPIYIDIKIGIKDINKFIYVLTGTVYIPSIFKYKTLLYIFSLIYTCLKSMIKG